MTDRGPAFSQPTAVNVAVRTRPGIDGAVLVMGAWCETCRQESQPSARGRCMWCDRLIYTTSGRAVGDPAVTGSADFPACRRGDQVKDDAQDATPLPVPSRPEDLARELLAAVEGTVAA